MELFDVMRTTFAARSYTGEPIPDDVLYRVLDHARFAPSGGNRQGWHVVVVRDSGTRDVLADLAVPAAKRYTAQIAAGQSPWNSVEPLAVEAEEIERTEPARRLTETFREASVVLVVCVDLRLVASTDQYLDRVGVISGASIYPFVWNILMGARQEGYGGTITTLAIAQEGRIKGLLGVPENVAVCAVVPLGRPVKQLTKLRRGPVEGFAVHERWNGDRLRPPGTGG
ncbi:MAG: nitroreductase family protein [Immundisolibacterales bacterium]|nr:nitroreductase family protein [Immundisolibacterales bacterium]